MRTTLLLVFAVMISACATSLERQTDSAAQDDCWQRAESYIRANMASIANEWREHEKYKQYQLCLSKRVSSSS